jgi:transposase
MFSTKDLELKKIDHLGIVAGIVDSIGIVEIINNLVGSNSEEKVSAGQVVKAMILNGLSMMSQPLYMFPKFFELIACEHLTHIPHPKMLQREITEMKIKGSIKTNR